MEGDINIVGKANIKYVKRSDWQKLLVCGGQLVVKYNIMRLHGAVIQKNI